MKSQPRPSLLVLSALLLCTVQQTAGGSTSHRSSSAPSSSTTTSPLEAGGRSRLTAPQNGLTETNSSSIHGTDSQESRQTSPKLKVERGQANGSTPNTSSGNVTTVHKEGLEGPTEQGGAPLCAYKVVEGGTEEQLCFRHTISGFKCEKGDCRTVVSAGSLVANILVNGSVLLQWSQVGARAVSGPNVTTGSGDPRTNLTGEERHRPHTVGGRHYRSRGFELSCWWNGSYTQFECAGVHLGPGCRDFLMTDLHENIPYRICLRAHSNPPWRPDQCVEFTLPPSGMQDIVIAMTAVGGAICVMLVIICLLVAYITENIMSATTQHADSYRTRSHN